mmetsp:Transcript_7054/g.19914  ORF Transcript_7054/g.19914 Transcript_7054/m.19914 type:complete len:214 (-) Transcript_7054:6641-7282(-)
MLSSLSLDEAQAGLMAIVLYFAGGLQALILLLLYLLLLLLFLLLFSPLLAVRHLLIHLHVLREGGCDIGPMGLLRRCTSGNGLEAGWCSPPRPIRPSGKLLQFSLWRRGCMLHRVHRRMPSCRRFLWQPGPIRGERMAYRREALAPRGGINRLRRFGQASRTCHSQGERLDSGRRERCKEQGPRCLLCCCQASLRPTSLSPMRPDVGRCGSVF